ncbi:peroxiredoxin-6-like [Mya arenaria]|uniref:peroxiredoxin-6-like n=1 Tax=Mya arenaria TaxID=6604 RepID=UPI0022E35171|nr:peroxiredoxin-6-like [Mya arenaria]
MGINLGDVFPNFEAEIFDETAANGLKKIKFHEWIGKDSWSILFSHPRDFTPVCTTELGMVSQLVDDFAKMKTKVIALSCDSVEEHKGWSKDVMDYSKQKAFGFPIISDPKRELAKQLGMIDPDEQTETGMPLTCRAVFIIGPDYKLKLSMLYPATTGRNFDEIKRVVTSLQLTATKKVATPANWKLGDKCMVIPSLSLDEAKKLFPKGVEVCQMPSGKGYMRFTPDPSDS